MHRIKVIDPDDSRLKRLHMFLSKEGIEQAERILDQLKARKEKQIDLKGKMGSG